MPLAPMTSLMLPQAWMAMGIPVLVPCRTARQPSVQTSERRPVPDEYVVLVPVLLCVSCR
jgi:hypothetical protein